MLAFLDTFCQALSARDGDRIRRLLRHPLARALPRAVRTEAMAIARMGEHGRLAPARALHFYYQTLQLLASPEPVVAEDALFALQHAEHPVFTGVAITA